MDQTSHKQTVKQTTTDALVQLYNHVIDLPDGPVKQKFLQRVCNYVHKISLNAAFNLHIEELILLHLIPLRQ